MPSLDALTALLDSDVFIAQLESWTAEDADAYLDHRDDDDFDGRWVAAHRHLSALPPPSDAQLAAVDALRERAYSKVYEHTQHPELAAYLSDDFELLALDELHGTGLATVAAFRSAFERGDVPR